MLVVVAAVLLWTLALQGVVVLGALAEGVLEEILTVLLVLLGLPTLVVAVAVALTSRKETVELVALVSSSSVT
jgi:membrane protease YdiL (CAAX protease family)